MEESGAILIRCRRWSDSSLIATWFTAGRGKTSTMAKGARRAGSPFAGMLDLFHRAEIAYAPARRGDLHTLREVRLEQAFDQSSPANLYLCGYFAELVDMATQPGEAAPGVYDLLRRAVEHLRMVPASRRALDFFESEICEQLGVGGGGSSPLAAIETYCGRVPASRANACRFLREGEAS
jgi:DNA repair protein RecO (recombination protein O)